MDLKKKIAFTQAMGRQKFAKGGAVRKLAGRKYFAAGGDTALSGPGTSGTDQNATNPNSGLMGTINQGLGINNNFQATSANIQNGTNANQLNNAYTSATGALGAQQNLANQLNPAVGNAVANQNAVQNQQLGIMNGTGPNPAMNELNQATATNTANQAAMMAGQRGASFNPGLIARQAAQQGAATQQQSAGQGATLGAQQQIAAGQNVANLANNQISQAGQATTGLNSAAQNEQAILQNANTSANNANVGMQSNINNNNAQTSAANQNMAANTLGGIESAASSIGSMFAKGGEVHHKIAEMNAQSMMHLRKNFDDGGAVDEPNLGSFKAGDDSSSAPNVASTASLPTDNANFGADWHTSSGGGGSGGGGGSSGMSSMMGLAAMMADGGPIQPNPLLGQGQINGTGAWTQAYFNPGSASNGPSIGGGGALPSGKTTDLAKSTKDAMASDPNKPQSSHNQTDDEAREGYLDAGAMLGSNNAEGQLDANNLDNPQDHTQMAAQGGVMGNHFHEYFSGGGKVPAMVSPGEIYLSPDKVHKVLHEDADPAKIGVKFKGKAKVKGDSLKNDTIPATLEEGGVVIDRQNMGSKEKRQLFVHKSMAKAKARR